MTIEVPKVYLREWREHFKLSGEKLGAPLRMTRGQVSQWENNDHQWTLEKLARFADALNKSAGASIHWLQLLGLPEDELSLAAGLARVYQAHERAIEAERNRAKKTGSKK